MDSGPARKSAHPGMTARFEESSMNQKAGTRPAVLSRMMLCRRVAQAEREGSARAFQTTSSWLSLPSWPSSLSSSSLS
jgi:hypothetical protein